jgi:hypothetical protein
VVIHGALLAGPPGTEDLLNVSISLSAFWLGVTSNE